MMSPPRTIWRPSQTPEASAAGLRNRGVVLTREMIENNLWNYDYEGGTNIVDVYVGYLRRKMDTGFDKKLIHTVWGSGWVLREE